MSVDTLAKQARSAYSEKRYNDAVKVLTESLSLKNCSIEARLNALDARSQCYSKLRKYDAALQDARSMLHISNKRSQNGYIRCSQAELLRGNHAAATKWLEHGINKMPQNKWDFQVQLERVKIAVRKHLADQKRRDPIASVPLEILQLILSYLDYQSVSKLLRVCRTWQKLLSRLPPLIHTVDFSQTRCKISYQACHAALRRLCAYPQVISFHALAPPAHNFAQSWLNKYPHLETLETLEFGDTSLSLGGIRFDKLTRVKRLSLSASQEISLERLLQILATCPALQDVSVHVAYGRNTIPERCSLHPQVQNLRMIEGSPLQYRLPANYVQYFPNLRSLSISGAQFEPSESDSSVSQLDLSSHIHLRRMRLSLRTQLPMKLVLPQSMEILDCTTSPGSLRQTSYILAEPLDLRNLHTLSLEGLSANSIMDRLGTLDISPRLQVLNLINSTSSCLSRMASQGLQVTRTCWRLSLSSEELNDQHVKSFLDLFPAIEDLTLEAPLISGVFISDLVHSKSSRLKKVLLQDCVKVSSDIQEWLKSQNIECRINKTAQEYGHRGLRWAW